MSTLEELLDEQLEEESLVCIIDNATRKITMPEDLKFFGVENDKRVERLHFVCPKQVGDERIDLMTCQNFIVYENANGEPGVYEVKDVTVDGDNVRFSWLFDEDVTKYNGYVKFIFYACILTGDELKNAWNTIPAQGFVEDGLDAVARIEERNPAILEHVLLKVAELERDVGSNQDFVIVKVNFDTNTASHRASEIKAAFEAGKIVVTMDSYGMLIPLYDGLSEIVTFEAIYESRGLKKAVLTIAEDKTVVFYTTTISGGASTTINEVSLLANSWVSSDNNDSLFSQVVDINGVTENSQVDLMPSVDQLLTFYEKDLTLVAENDGGSVTVYAIGQKPNNDYTLQVALTEVN